VILHWKRLEDSERNTVWRESHDGVIGFAVVCIVDID